MATALPSPRTPAWYDRRGARWSAVGLIAVGVVLAVVGVLAFVSARQVTSDAAPARAQLVAVEQEYATVQQQRDDAVAQATAARTAAGAVDDRVAALDAAIQTVDAQYGVVVQAQNAIAECGNDSTLSDVQLLTCMNAPFQTYKAAAAQFADDVSALHAATAALEEATQ